MSSALTASFSIQDFAVLAQPLAKLVFLRNGFRRNEGIAQRLSARKILVGSILVENQAKARRSLGKLSEYVTSSARQHLGHSGPGSGVVKHGFGFAVVLKLWPWKEVQFSAA